MRAHSDLSPAGRGEERLRQSRRNTLHSATNIIETASMASFDFAPLLTTGLPAPAAKWTGFPKYNFSGGHNDADHVPVDRLIAASTAVLEREGSTLATYGLESGPLGYHPLREFLVAKLKWHAGI